MIYVLPLKDCITSENEGNNDVPSIEELVNKDIHFLFIFRQPSLPFMSVLGIMDCITSRDGCLCQVIRMIAYMFYKT